ncbi:restriction endonuclease subunit S [Methylomarinum vadi]|uniref:restriction endonuclease subunit S n=1 Tax=Methylomarinum vadi TaxID=438855 RepID=UPI00068BC89E|nr:restriction endonuclease subunit S [Methylomarinum vadi]
MDAKRFLAEFGHIANAPGGIEQLRKLVLHLAVSGDLTKEGDQVNAEALLISILEKKSNHPEKKKVVHKQAYIDRSSVIAPSHWAVCRIGDLVLTITGGGTPSKRNLAYWNGDIFWASVKDLSDHRFLSTTQDRITKEGLNNSSSNLIPEGHIIVCTRMGLGKIVINTVPMAINQDLKALELPSEVNKDFFLILYKTREVSGKGTTVAGIKQNELLALPAVLPPLEEQARIVAKVDELMALCDRLEKQQQHKRELQNQLRQAALQAVAAATSPLELKQHWQRLQDNFEHLFTVPEDVISLRQLIRSLAIMGCLTEQNEEEKLSNRLLNAIASKMHEIEDGDLDWSIPGSWKWVRTAILGEARLGKMLDKSKNKGISYPYLRNKNVRWDSFDLSDLLEMKIEEHEIQKVSVTKGDLVICEGGEPGRAAIWELDEPFIIQKALHRFRCIEDVMPRYMLICLECDYFSGRLSRFYTGATIKHLTGKSLANYSIPVPPLPEQKRIIKRVDELMQFCDTLEANLRSANKIAEQLATAAVASLTDINATNEEAPLTGRQSEPTAPVKLYTGKPDSQNAARCSISSSDEACVSGGA